MSALATAGALFDSAHPGSAHIDGYEHAPGWGCEVRMPKAELTVKLKVRRYVLFDLTPVLPAVGVIVRVGRWLTFVMQVGTVYVCIVYDPNGWRFKFELRPS
jgi:hypothetical protein